MKGFVSTDYCKYKHLALSGSSFSDSVFGRDLSEEFHPASQQAPWVVIRCCQELEQRAAQTGMTK